LYQPLAWWAFFLLAKLSHAPPPDAPGGQPTPEAAGGQTAKVHVVSLLFVKFLVFVPGINLFTNANWLSGKRHGWAERLEIRAADSECISAVSSEQPSSVGRSWLVHTIFLKKKAVLRGADKQIFIPQ
jgi:hypothetical protein